VRRLATLLLALWCGAAQAQLCTPNLAGCTYPAPAYPQSLSAVTQFAPGMSACTPPACVPLYIFDALPFDAANPDSYTLQANYQAALADPEASGAKVLLPWAVMEPAAGSYAWATMTASLASTGELTVSSVPGTPIAVGMMINAVGVPYGAQVQAFGTGGTSGVGGTGTYMLTLGATVASRAMVGTNINDPLQNLAQWLSVSRPQTLILGVYAGEASPAWLAGSPYNVPFPQEPLPVNPGSNYYPGNILTVQGGTCSQQPQILVTDVLVNGNLSSSASTPGPVGMAVEYANSLACTVAPPNPASVTGGNGSGATFNLNSGGGFYAGGFSNQSVCTQYSLPVPTGSAYQTQYEAAVAALLSYLSVATLSDGSTTMLSRLHGIEMSGMVALRDEEQGVFAGGCTGTDPANSRIIVQTQGDTGTVFTSNGYTQAAAVSAFEAMVTSIKSLLVAAGASTVKIVTMAAQQDCYGWPWVNAQGVATTQCPVDLNNYEQTIPWLATTYGTQAVIGYDEASLATKGSGSPIPSKYLPYAARLGMLTDLQYNGNACDSGNPGCGNNAASCGGKSDGVFATPQCYAAIAAYYGSPMVSPGNALAWREGRAKDWFNGMWWTAVPH
jgi:hypothetical protein